MIAVSDFQETGRRATTTTYALQRLRPNERRSGAAAPRAEKERGDKRNEILFWLISRHYSDLGRGGSEAIMGNMSKWPKKKSIIPIGII